ncbi:MAG TPA: hypothetical protein VF091_07340 [Gaiellaceae bacterium]
MQRKGFPPSAPLPVEAAIALCALAVVAVEILVTYSRVPAHELYHVSGSGLEGGLSRAVVFANFPSALVAMAVLGISYERLRYRAVAIVAAALCAFVFWPGVVSEANLDARPVNAAAAIGVLLTCLLVARAPLSSTGRQAGDGARVALAVPLVLVSLPWFAAELGFFLDGVPLLGRLFETGHYLPDRPGLPPFPPAVHHGHHHGMDGLILVLSALLLSRAVDSIRGRALRSAVTAYLALMLCYGIGNMANDFWTEQIFKRGWTSWQIPNVLEPRATIAWGIIVVAAAVIWWVSRAVAASRSRDPGPAVPHG